MPTPRGKDKWDTFWKRKCVMGHHVGVLHSEKNRWCQRSRIVRTLISSIANKNLPWCATKIIASVSQIVLFGVGHPEPFVKDAHPFATEDGISDPSDSFSETRFSGVVVAGW